MLFNHELPVTKFSGPFENSLAVVSKLEDACGFREKRSIALPVNIALLFRKLSLVKEVFRVMKTDGAEGLNRREKPAESRRQIISKGFSQLVGFLCS